MDNRFISIPEVIYLDARGDGGGMACSTFLSSPSSESLLSSGHSRDSSRERVRVPHMTAT